MNRTTARQQQDGVAPILLPPHGYLLARGQTWQERAVTLALLRYWRARDKGKKVGDVGAHLN